jgi:hypothetical protein
MKLSLVSGPNNDIVGLQLGSTGDVKVLEII